MRRTTGANVFLACLLAGDALFIGADILQRQNVLHDVRFLVTHERGYGEVFQYCKAGFGSLLLVWLRFRRRSATALTWAGLLALVLLDDALEIHEHAGEHLAAALHLPAIGSLRANQLGELMFYAALGVACLAALIAAWWHADAEERALSRSLFGWFAALGFCAIVLDAVDSLLRKTVMAVEFALFEDGGEMVILSFLVATVWSAFQRAGVHTRNAGRLTREPPI